MFLKYITLTSRYLQKNKCSPRKENTFKNMIKKLSVLIRMAATRPGQIPMTIQDQRYQSTIRMSPH